MKPKTDYGLPAHIAGELAITFVPLDLNNDGFIDAHELRASITAAMPQLVKDPALKDRLVDAILVHADLDDDGRVDFTEFCVFLDNHRSDQTKTVSSLRHVAEENGLHEATALIVKSSPAVLRSLFVSFVSNGHTLPESCPEAPPVLFEAFNGVSADAIGQLLKVFETLKYGGMKRRASLMKRTGTIAQLHQEDSVLRNPLSHLTQSQLNHLARHLHTDQSRRPKTSSSPERHYETASEIAEVLRGMFDEEVKDALLEDAAEMLLTTFHNVDESTLGEFIASIHAFATNHVQSVESDLSAQVYTVSELPQETQSLLTSSLTNEEVDLLRDTFVRLDRDGDGFVSLDDCQRVAEDVLGHKFATFLPYLNALYRIADKDADGSLSLSEFLLSFVEGPGVVPQEVITECVAAVKVRLTDAELLAMKVAFSNMDQNCDGTLDFKEISHAVDVALRPHVGDGLLTPGYVRDVVDAMLSKADKDLDGRLNMSEFIRSIQEDHGVIPLQLIECFGVAGGPAHHSTGSNNTKNATTQEEKPKQKKGKTRTTASGGRTSTSPTPTPTGTSNANATDGTFQEVEAATALFRLVDQNNDGLISIADIGGVLVQMLQKRHPLWAADYYKIVAESLFSNADRNGDGFLSLPDYLETFRTGYAMLPEGFSDDIGEQLVTRLNEDARRQAVAAVLAANSDAAWKGLVEAAYKAVGCNPHELVLLLEHLAPVAQQRNAIAHLLQVPNAAANANSIHSTPAVEEEDKKKKQKDAKKAESKKEKPSPKKEAAPVAAEAAAAAAPPKPKVAPPPLVEIGHEEFQEARKVLRSLAQANTELSLSDLQSKLLTALTDYLFGDASGAQKMVEAFSYHCEPFTCKQQTVLLDSLSGMLLGDGVAAEEFGWTIPSDEERLAKASGLVTDLLTSYGSRSFLAEALLEADPLRSGELNYKTLRGALLTKVPVAVDKRSIVLRSIRNTGVRHAITGLYSTLDFEERFTFGYYVTPASPYPANSLLRWFTHNERSLLNEVLSTFDFIFEDEAAPAEAKAAAIQRGLSNAIKQHQELRTLAPIENLHTAARLVAEMVVFEKKALSEIRKDPSALTFAWTLLPSATRCDHAIRLLRCRVGEDAALRRLLRSILFTDRNVNGIVPKVVLMEAMSAELRLIQPTWNDATVLRITEEFLLANETDEKGFVLIGKMLDAFTQAVSLVTPTHATTVLVRTPLSDPPALSAAMFHLHEKASITIEELQSVGDGGNGRHNIGPILKFFETCCLDATKEENSMDIRPLFRAAAFHPEGLVIQLAGLEDSLAQRALFAVLPVPKQRALAATFAALDSNKDNVLDWDELSATLLRYVVSHNNVAPGDAMEAAQLLYTRMDLLKIKLISIEEFLASIANGTLKTEGILNEPYRPSTTPANVAGRGPSTVSTVADTPTKAKVSRLKSEGLADDDLLEQFNAYDSNKNGYLDANEFAVRYQKMEHYGLTPSLPEIRRLFRSICVDPTKMTFDEYCVLMLRKSRM